MFSSQLGRVARANCSSTTCTAQRTAATFSAVSGSLSCSQALRQRRPSSSKASCPPDEGPDGAKPAAPAQQTAPAARSSNARLARSKKAREAMADKAAVAAAIRRQDMKQESRASKQESKLDNVAFTNLPSVPTTEELRVPDITLSSFFSLHRPLSLQSPIPPPSTMEIFNSILEPSKPRVKNPADVIYTLRNSISALEGASTPSSSSPRSQSERDLRWEIIQESASNAAAGPRHLDGAPSPRARTLEEIVGSLRPFAAPPAPVAHDAAAAQAKLATAQNTPTQQAATEAGTRDRTFQSTVLLHETTGADGKTTVTAQMSPIVQISSDHDDGVSEQQRAPRFARNGITMGDQPSRTPFLDRMRQRHVRYAEYRDDRVQRNEDERLAISVKRQRKLKMKKHKYKKLMKKTRNLRRRLDRN